MPFEFQDDVDFNQNEGLRFVVHNSSATPSAGVEGQLYYDTDEKIIYYYDGTAWQAVGSGSGGGVLSGVGPPDPGDGENGQFYINTSNYDIYGPKTLGAWGSPTSLIGPQGPEGDPGVDGDDGAPGDDGVDGNTLLSGMGAPGGGTGVNGDFYIDLSTWDIYGPKTAGAWGSGQSLIGPTGGDLPPGGTAGQILIKEGPVDFDADWYDPPNSGSVAWVWDESATPNYEEDPIEMWIGPEEPQDDGATPNYGDLWFDTSELNNFIPAVASEVVFSDSGLAIITGVSNVQTALAMVDAELEALQNKENGPHVSRQTSLTDVTSTGGTAYVQWGTEEIVFDDALWSGNVTVEAHLLGYFADVDINEFVDARLNISVNNGSSWTTGHPAIESRAAGTVTTDHRDSIACFQLLSNVTPTGDIQVRAEVRTLTGSNQANFHGGKIIATVRPAHASDN